TLTLFKAEDYLVRALELAPGDARATSSLAEVSFLLGKYEAAAELWRRLLPELSERSAADLQARLERMERGALPRVPAVDYLEALAGALSLKEAGADEEAAAIFTDIMADEAFVNEFPMAEIPYLFALCCIDLGRERDARTLLRRALRMNPDYAEARSALEILEK